MLKELLIFGVISSSNMSYVNVEKIEAYQSNDTVKELSFEFEGSYNCLNDLNVKINVYDGTYKGTYSNNLEFIGNKKARTKIDFDIENDFYILIDIYNGNDLIIEGAKLNFYIQQDCYLNKDNRFCKRISKSEYRDGITKDIYVNINVNSGVFDKFLTTNKLNLEDIKFSGEYSFENAKSVFVIEEKIEGYDVYYSKRYIFPVSISKKSYNHFILINDYYVDVLSFKFSEYYFDNGVKTSSIHFPFNKEYKEYNCGIVIEDFINIELDFTVAVSDGLFGSCHNSKFCLMRNRL